TPFTIAGFSDLPHAGDLFVVVKTKKDAEAYIQSSIEPTIQSDQSEEIEKHVVFLPIIIKSDVVGSKEAIEFELKKVKIDHVKLKIIRSETGDISEDDTKLAITNENTVIIGFNVKIDSQARSIIERNNISH